VSIGAYSGMMIRKKEILELRKRLADRTMHAKKMEDRWRYGGTWTLNPDLNPNPNRRL